MLFVVLYLKKIYNLNIIMSLYDILGVEYTASYADIKTAYKKLAVIHHPDKPTGSSEVFKEIKKAYTTLYNKDSRKLYDSSIANADPYKDILNIITSSNLFKHFLDMRKQEETRQNIISSLNIIESLECSLEDRYLNKTKRIELIRDTLPSKIFDVSLVDNVAIIRNEGETNGKVCGDVFINVTVRENKSYRIDNFNLHRNIIISFDEYINGGTLTVDHFDEEIIICHEGFIKNSILRIENRGLIKNIVRDKLVRGDLFLKINFK